MILVEEQTRIESSGVIAERSHSRESRFTFRRSRVGDVAELRLDVGERGEIGDVLCRLRWCFARSSLSVAKQLEWDDTGAHL
jgi:hypothetical protein